MTQHFAIAVDSNGFLVVYVPLFHLWELVRQLPPGLPAIAYHYPTGQAQVSFPGLDAALARRILDAALREEGVSPAWAQPL